MAAVLFTAGYVATAVLAGTLASTPATSPDLVRVVLWSVVLCGLVGAAAIAAGLRPGRGLGCPGSRRPWSRRPRPAARC